MRTSSTRLVARVALSFGALVATVVLAEVLLQIAAVVVRATGRESADRFLTGRTRVVAFGDSHTYGLYLKPEQAYPAQLESLWNARPGVPAIEVVNLGYPGTNSSILAREFPEALRSLDPDVAIVLIGVNDMWTEHVELGPEPDRWDRLVATIRLESRLLRFLSILAADHDEERVAPIGRQEDEIPSGFVGRVDADGAMLDLGFEGMRQGRPGLDGPRLLANLDRLAREAAANGVELVLMTYPARGGFYDFSNKIIREAAQASGVRLVDLAPVFRERCADRACAELLFEDGHADAAGYVLIAETVTLSIGDLFDR